MYEVTLVSAFAIFMYNNCTRQLYSFKFALSFQSASHSFSVLAPRDGVMTYPIIEVLRESNSSCGYYATVLPLH